MGPQLYRCGNMSIPLTQVFLVMLQWGRNFIVAEMYWNDCLASGPWQASMGPQLYRCGNGTGRPPTTGARWRFNGAATLSLRKSFTNKHTAIDMQMLQWGRNFIVAEISQLYMTILLIVELQWGRNFIVAEMAYLLMPPMSRPPLQWGRNFIVAEMLDKATVDMLQRVASMGPQLYRCGN